MIRKTFYLLFCFAILGCSFTDDKVERLETKDIHTKDGFSFSKEQGLKYVEIAKAFTEANSKSILGEHYKDVKLSGLFAFCYCSFKIEDKEYLTVYLHEKSSNSRNLDDVLKKGYTNLVFEIDSKEDNLYVPGLIKMYPTQDYIEAKMKEMNIGSDDELDLRNLVDTRDFRGTQVCFSPTETRLLRSEDLKINNGSGMIGNVWLPEIYILPKKYGPYLPPDGSNPHPDRPVWGGGGGTIGGGGIGGGTTGGLPPGGGDCGGGGGTGGPESFWRYKVESKEEKEKRIKDPKRILADSDVSKAIQKQWDESLKLPKGQIQERGFCIYYSASEEKYYTGQVQVGPIVTDPFVRADVNMTYYTAPPASLGFPIDVELVAGFHTHPEVLPNDKNFARLVGLTKEDKQVGIDLKITMITKDFIGRYIEDLGGYGIFHNESSNNAPTKLYYSNAR
ncbi:hypothetical protein [Myroides odoratus]|uniref:hypothetical protein n=1 Tax=Myroides odoratus TaxID=256 RepID=UPI0015593697|nr:hypothetical protein [Myroides odoratus]WQD57018.1 hypothetical protein U0010_16060 [Myroides odoratus]